MQISNVDKMLLKIASTIAMVIGLLCCFTIIGTILGVPIIMGAFYISSLIVTSKENVILNKNKILLWALFYFLTLNVVSAILIVIAYFRISKSNVIDAVVIEHEDVKEDINNENEPQDKIAKLKLMKEQGLLTEQEYNKLVQEVDEK